MATFSKAGILLLGLTLVTSGCSGIHQEAKQSTDAAHEALSTPGQTAANDLPATWVGGVDLPDRFLPVRLHLEPEGGGSVLLPKKGAAPIRVETLSPDSIRFVLDADETEYVFDGAVSMKPVEARGGFGPLGNADIRFPFRLVPVHRTAVDELRPYEGVYRFGDGRAMRARAEEPGVLRMYDEVAGSFHTLYPLGGGRFFQAAGLTSPFPREAEVALNANGMEHGVWGKGMRDPIRSVPVAIRDDGSGSTVSVGSVAIRFLPLEPGEFAMGSAARPTDAIAAFGLKVDSLSAFEHPPRRVRLTRPALLGQTEVTNAQFGAFVADEAYATTAERQGFGLLWKGEGFNRVTGANWRSPGRETRPDEPVTLVSWEDATAFCDWLSRRIGRTCRLPTEAEWEYAARSGHSGFFGFAGGPSDLSRIAWYGANADGHAHSVAAKEPNAGGFYDMHGNVWEWCLDWYSFFDVGQSVIDPRGPSDGSTRVLRGGSWLNSAFDCRVGYRAHDAPDLAEPHIGFRPALEP